MSKEIALINFNEDQIALIKAQIAPKATDNELQLFLYQARRTGLDPLTRQIYAIHRNCKETEYGKEVWKQKMTIQTSIDGFRVIAERSGDYAGQDEPIFDESDGLKSCKITVYRFRGDVRYPAAVGIAYFKEYVQDSPLWKKMPHTMIAKVAEALALRKAYPQDLSGLYTGDEMEQANIPDATPSNNHSQLKGVVKGASEDMGELCEQKKSDKALAFFQSVKDQVEACGSAEEVEAMFEDGKIFKKLINYPKLKEMLKDSQLAMLQILDPEKYDTSDWHTPEPIENDANLIQAG